MDSNGNNRVQNNQRHLHESSPIWFSHNEARHDFAFSFKRLKTEFKWHKTKRMWNWSNCTVSAIKREDGKIRITIRSPRLIHSRLRKRVVKLKYMLQFDIGQIGDLEEGEYKEPVNNLKGWDGNLYARWYMELDENYCIWQWKEKEKSKENSELAAIHQELKNTQGQTYDVTRNRIFNTRSQQDDARIIPVVYQPAVDTLKNFLREVHCFNVDENTMQVTLLFNNEHLIYHNYPLIDFFYRIYRLIRYHRVTDVESFIIKLENGVPKKFQFHKIYSGAKSMDNDDVHLDDDVHDFHHVKYFFANEKHPDIFVNTANHALSYDDTNRKIWKCEYIPWEDDCAIILGNKSLEELDSGFAKLRNHLTKVA